MEKENHLIGTFHMDLASPEIMEKVLNEVQPDILVGEANELLDLKTEIRDMVWCTLFDTLEIDEETQAMFYATENDKEHRASRLHAHRKGIPYYMIDAPENVDYDEAKAFARKYLAEEFAALPPEEAKEKLTAYIKGNYARHFDAQDENPPCARLYDTENMLNPGSKNWLGRDKHITKELKKIMDENPDKSILGFFGTIHVVDPLHPRVQELFDTPFENMRYLLQDRNVKFSKLIDWKF